MFGDITKYIKKERKKQINKIKVKNKILRNEKQEKNQHQSVANFSQVFEIEANFKMF